MTGLVLALTMLAASPVERHVTLRVGEMKAFHVPGLQGIACGCHGVGATGTHDERVLLTGTTPGVTSVLVLREGERPTMRFIVRTLARPGSRSGSRPKSSPAAR